jgi:TRAP-type transport system periplasmic protein
MITRIICDHVHVSPPLSAAVRRLLSSLLLLLAACAAAPEPGTHTLRYATPYPPQHPFSRADQLWIDHVEAASRGALQIDAFWSGMLTSSDQSVIELRHGVADIAAIQPIYERGGTRVLRTQTGFYAGARGFSDQVAVFKCLAERFPVFGGELSGLTVLAVQGGNLPGIVTKNMRVQRLRDLSGLRLRAPSELMELLEALGADPVNMPMGDVYASLARGVIDGVVAPLDALRSLHLAEVAHDFTRLSIPRGAYPARAIRDARLHALPAHLQQLLLDSGKVWEAALANELARAQAGGQSYAREHGIRLNDFPDAEQLAFDQAYNRAAQARARALHIKDVDGPAVFEAAQRWVKQLQSDTTGATFTMRCL